MKRYASGVGASWRSSRAAHSVVNGSSHCCAGSVMTRAVVGELMRISAARVQVQNMTLTIIIVILKMHAPFGSTGSCTCKRQSSYLVNQAHLLPHTRNLT